VSLDLIRWGVPGPYEVVFSTRTGGVSEGPFTSLNLGRKLGDVPDRVDENRRRLCAEVGTDPNRLALNFQRHTAVVNRAAPDVPMLARGADCALVALARTNGARPALAVLHAGRIGLLAGIVEAGVAALGGRPAAIVGPAIGPCCYEVGKEIAGAFGARFGADVVENGKLDLWTSAERALLEAGCASVERLELCTACDPDRFFSYRRDGKPRGGHGILARVA